MIDKCADLLFIINKNRRGLHLVCNAGFISMSRVVVEVLHSRHKAAAAVVKQANKQRENFTNTLDYPRKP